MTGSRNDSSSGLASMLVLLILKLDKVSEKLDKGSEISAQHAVLLKEIHGLVSASKPGTIPWGKLLPWALRIFGPLVQSHVLPWIIAGLQGLIAAIVIVWKASTRGWLSW